MNDLKIELNRLQEELESIRLGPLIHQLNRRREELDLAESELEIRERDLVHRATQLDLAFASLRRTQEEQEDELKRRVESQRAHEEKSLAEIARVEDLRRIDREAREAEIAAREETLRKEREKLRTRRVAQEEELVEKERLLNSGLAQARRALMEKTAEADAESETLERRASALREDEVRLQTLGLKLTTREAELERMITAAEEAQKALEAEQALSRSRNARPVEKPLNLTPAWEAISREAAAASARLTRLRAMTLPSAAQDRLRGLTHLLKGLQEKLELLLHLGRGVEDRIIEGSVLEPLRACLAAWAPVLRVRGIRIARRLPKNLPACTLDQESTLTAFNQIVRNAMEAMPGGGVLTVAAVQKGSTVEVSFADSGPGIAPEMLPQVFLPLRSDKEGHLGLGLAAAAAIFKRQRGGLAASGQKNTGGRLRCAFSLTRNDSPA